MVPQHPTITETIDGIIRIMQPEIIYPFGEVWGPAFHPLLPVQQENRIQMERCYHKMISEELITTDIGPFIGASLTAALMTKQYWGIQVKLTDFGDNVRENGGWLKHVEDQKPKKTFWNITLIVAIGELIIGAGLLWFAYLTNDRAERLEGVETKYKEREQLVESLHKSNDSLSNLSKTQESAIQRLSHKLDSIQTAKSVPPKKKGK